MSSEPTGPSDKAGKGTQAIQQSSQRSPITPQRLGDLHLRCSNDVLITPTDLWSTAFLEAFDTFEPKMDIARSTDKTIEQLFDDLGNINRLHSEESSFRRGLAHLRSVKAPLDNLKLALDLANPLVSFEPTAAIIVGIVRGVTTVMISHEIHSFKLAVASRAKASALTYLIRSLSALQALTWNSQNSSETCWNKRRIAAADYLRYRSKRCEHDEGRARTARASAQAFAIFRRL